MLNPILTDGRGSALVVSYPQDYLATTAILRHVMFEFSDRLMIPEGINYECTGCGNCCLQWPVPSTSEDRERILELAHELLMRENDGISLHTSGSAVLTMPSANEQNADRQLLRASNSLPPKIFNRVNLSALPDNKQKFDYLMEKRADGKCLFLTPENRCLLHVEFGAEAKPSMCQLFPYTFTEAPDGFYASVSFASTGTLLNQGPPLTGQEEFLMNRLALFKRLFPDLQLDWSKSQLIDGLPLSWHEYLPIEGKLIEVINGKTTVCAPDSGMGGKYLESCETALLAAKSASLDHSIISRLFEAGNYLATLIPSSFELDRESLLPLPSSKVDILLWRYMIELYFPANAYASAQDLPSAQELMKRMAGEEPLPVVSKDKACPDDVLDALKNCQPETVAACAEGPLYPASEDLFRRFVYLRLFSKLYFGPGFAHLSLAAGFHHLAVILAIIKMRAKLERLINGEKSQAEEFLLHCSWLQSLERRLTSIRHTRESATILQVLLESPSRFQRLLAMAI